MSQREKGKKTMREKVRERGKGRKEIKGEGWVIYTEKDKDNREREKRKREVERRLRGILGEFIEK